MAKPADDGEPTVDVWSRKSKCILCQETYGTAALRSQHELEQPHKKKVAIYQFIKTYLKNSNENLPSALVRRFRISKEKAAGIECLHEIRFPWAASGWWVCSICYESGCTLEQAEHHSRSPSHIQMYLDEFAPEKATKPKKLKGHPFEYYAELIRAKDELYGEQGEIPPEVFELDLPKEEAMAKLRISTVAQPPKETLTLNLEDDETVKRAIVRCTVCHEVIPCFRKNLNKVWSVHENSPEHRRAAAIQGILTHLPCEEVLEDETDEPTAFGFKWRQIGTTYFGPVCGKSFLLTTGTQHFCLLCQCQAQSIEEHFSSEYHILRFLSIKKTQDMIVYIDQSPDVRRDKMTDLLNKIPLDNENYRRLACATLPTAILELQSPEILDAAQSLPPLEHFSFDADCLICNNCNEVIPIKKTEVANAEQLWNKHANSAGHFDVISRRSCYRFYEEFFVPILPTIKTPPPSLHGEWKVIEIDEKTSYKVQTHCDVGLEWIVEDQEVGEIICTLCCRTYKKDSTEGINNHIRSYMHLNRYLHMSNRGLLALVMGQSTEKGVLDLMMDWLQKTYRPVESFVYDVHTMLPAILRNNWGQMQVYSPEKATRISKKATISVETMCLPFFPPTDRAVYSTLDSVLDRIADSTEQKQNVWDLLQVLRQSPFRIVYMDDVDNKNSRRWLIRCMACQQTFSTTVETLVHDLYSSHIFTDEHDCRLQSLELFHQDRYRYAEDTSAQTVKPFVQKDPSKKVSWQWNNESQRYSFVLTVVGLEDIVERKSSVLYPDRGADFYCRICAESIPRRNLFLEAHVRSWKHVMNYVQNYHPMTIFELDAQKADEKLERRMIASILKDAKPSTPYPIPVYDPIGEQERKTQQAEARQKEKERQDSLAESRKKAEQERMAREEQKRQLLAKEKAAQERLRQESQTREKEMMEKHMRLKAEQAALKSNLVNKEVEAAAASARQYVMSQAAKSKGNSRDDRHPAPSLSEFISFQQEKEREEARRKLDDVNFKKKAQEFLNKIYLKPPETQLNIAQQALIVPTVTIRPMMSVPPPGYVNTSIPPPMITVPNPPYNAYMPTAGPMPVYPSQSDDMDISRGRSRSPSPRRGSRKRRSRSRSRSRDRRDRDRRRSRSQSPPSRRSPSRRDKLHGLRDISPPRRDHRRSSLSPVSVSPPTVRPPVKKTYPLMAPRASLRGRTADPSMENPAICGNKVNLMDYIWRQGAEKIPPNELPEDFSKKATSLDGNLGLDNIYEVVCADCPELDTLYCAICGVWNTPVEILKHILTQEHKLAFLYRNYKEYHQMVMSETVSSMRTTILEELTKKLWRKEQVHPGVCYRMRTVVGKEAMHRVWPDHPHFQSNAWKAMESRQTRDKAALVNVPAPVGRDALGGFSSLHPSTQPPTMPSSMPPYFNPNMPPPGMPPSHMMVPTAVPPVVVPPPVAVIAKDTDMRIKSRSPKERKRSRSHDRRRSPSPRHGSSRVTSKRRRSRSPVRDRDSRRRSRSREREREQRHRSRDRHNKKDEPAKIISKDDMQWMSESARFLQSIGKASGSTPTQYMATGSQIPASAIEPISRGGLSSLGSQDDTANQRKILGLMYTMQQELEKHGRVDENRLKQVSLEMGLNLSERQTGELMATLMEKFKPLANKPHQLNLAEFGIRSSSLMAPMGYPYPQYTQATQQPYQTKDDVALNKILSGIQGSLAQLKEDRPQSPIVKPMSYNFSRTDDFFKDTGYSMVYPNDPEELEREKKEKQERRQMAKDKIDATIEELKARAEQLNNGENEDEDWEGLESDLGQWFGTKKDASSTGTPKDPAIEIVEVRNSSNAKLGMPTTWAQPVPQPVKQQPAQNPGPSTAQEVIPIAPGQKMRLARTMLPNGKAIAQPESSTASAIAATSTPQYSMPPTYPPAAASTVTLSTQINPALATAALPQQQYYNYNQGYQQPQHVYAYGQAQYTAGVYQPQQTYYPGYQPAPQQYVQPYQQQQQQPTQPAAQQQPAVPGVPGMQQPTQQYYGGYSQQYRY